MNITEPAPPPHSKAEVLAWLKQSHRDAVKMLRLYQAKASKIDDSIKKRRPPLLHNDPIFRKRAGAYFDVKQCECDIVMTQAAIDLLNSKLDPNS